MIKRWAPAAHQPWASDAKAEVRNPLWLEPMIRWPWFFWWVGVPSMQIFQSSRLPTIARVKQRPPNCWRRFAWKRWEALVIQDERSWIPMFLNSLFLNSFGMFWEHKLFWEHMLTITYPRRRYHLKSRYVSLPWAQYCSKNGYCLYYPHWAGGSPRATLTGKKYVFS